MEDRREVVDAPGDCGIVRTEFRHPGRQRALEQRFGEVEPTQALVHRGKVMDVGGGGDVIGAERFFTQAGRFLGVGQGIEELALPVELEAAPGRFLQRVVLD